METNYTPGLVLENKHADIGTDTNRWNAYHLQLDFEKLINILIRKRITHAASLRLKSFHVTLNSHRTRVEETVNNDK